MITEEEICRIHQEAHQLGYEQGFSAGMARARELMIEAITADRMYPTTAECTAAYEKVFVKPVVPASEPAEEASA